MTDSDLEIELKRARFNLGDPLKKFFLAKPMVRTPGIEPESQH